MMAVASRSKFTLITVGVAAVLALSGCSVVAQVKDLAQTHSPAAAQSKTDACASLQKNMSESIDQLTSSVSTAATDPARAIAGLGAVTSSLDSALEKISNKDVGKVGKAADSALKKMLAQIKEIQADPQHADTVAFMTTVKSVQDAFVRIGKTCG